MEELKPNSEYDSQTTQALIEFTKLRTWFYYEELEIGAQKSTKSLPKNVIAIIIEGDVVISCNEFTNIKIHKGQLAFYRSHSLVKYTILSNTKILYMAFDILLSEHDMLAVWSYKSLENNVKPEFTILNVKGHLQNFLDASLYWVKDNKMSIEFHEIKHKELLWILRATYAKSELTSLFQPLISKTIYFKEFILSKWTQNVSIDEIIKASHLSKATFLRKFKKEFQITPHQWKLAQNSQLILHKANQPGIRVKDLMNEIGICEQSHFNKFCKRHFNCTPKDLIRKCQNENITIDGDSTKKLQIDNI